MPERIGLAAVLEMKDFNKGMKSYTGSIKKMNDLTKAITGKMGRAFVSVGKFVGKTMVAGIAVGATAIAGLGVGMAKLAIDAAPLQGIKAAFEGITEASGVASDEMLAALKKSSAGMLTNKAAMETYNLAAMLVGDTFANDLPNAMGYLTKVSAATGESMDFMMTSLVRGVGRLSPMILDNLGIQVDLTKAYEDFAEEQGVVVEEMTKAQQQTALMNQVMGLLQKNTAAMPEVTGTAAAAMGSLKAQLQDTKDTIGLALLPMFTKIMSRVSAFAKENLPKLVAAFEKKLIPAISQLVDKVGWIIDAFRDAGIVSSEFEEALSSIVGEKTARLFVDMADAISQFIQKMGWVIDAFRDAGIVSSEFEEALSSIVGEEAARGIVDFAAAVQDAIAWVTTAIGEFQRGFAWATSEGMDPFTVAIAGVAEVLDDFLGEEVMDRIWDFHESVQAAMIFIEENATPILAGLATVITAKLIIAMVAWATTMWTTTIPAIVAAVVAAGPLILIIGAIGLAVALLVKAWQSDWKGIRTILTKFWHETAKPTFAILKVWFTKTLPAALVTIRDWFVETWEKITTAVTEAWKKAVKIFEDVKKWFTVTLPTAIWNSWETIKATIASAIAVVRATISNALAAIRAAWETAWGAVQSFLRQAWETMRVIFVTALILILDIFGIKLEDLIRLWRTSWDNMIAGLSMAWEAIKTIVETVFTVVRTWLSTQLQLMLTGWRLIWDFVSTKATEIWAAIQTTIETVFTAIRDWLDERLEELSTAWAFVWDAISTKASEIWEAIKTVVGNAIQAVWKSITDMYDEIKSAVTKPLTDARQAVRDTFDDWKNLGKDLVGGIASGIRDKAQSVINSIVDAIKAAIRRAKALIRGFSPSRVFMDIGASMMEGLALGVARTAAIPIAVTSEVMHRVSAPALFQRPAMTMPASRSSSVNVNMGGVNIYDQMGAAVFEARVRQIMASSVGG